MIFFPSLPLLGGGKRLVIVFHACRSINSNKFSGSIPASLGRLSKLYWFDLADNKLSGGLPVFDGTNPGLDNLTNTKHLYVQFRSPELNSLILGYFESPDRVVVS
jgi:hypothetical protein